MISAARQLLELPRRVFELSLQELQILIHIKRLRDRRPISMVRVIAVA
jgi:hypothetical protein